MPEYTEPVKHGFHPTHCLKQGSYPPAEYYCIHCEAREMFNDWLRYDCQYIQDTKQKRNNYGA